MRNKVTTVIVTPTPGDSVISSRSIGPDGAEIYVVNVRIDDDPNLHRWLLAESWTRAAYGGGLHAQRPSVGLCETLGIPRGKPVSLAEVIGRLCSLGGEHPVTAVRALGGDCRVVALNIIYDVPRDPLGIPTVRPKPQALSTDPAVLAELEATRKAAEDAAMMERLTISMGRDASKAYDKRERDAQRELKSMATKTAREFMRQARELAGEKAGRWKMECFARGERWATGKGYADLALPMRDAQALHDAGVSEQEEQARCHATAFAAEKRDQPSIDKYHEILNSWRPQQIRWDELHPDELAMYNRALDLYIAGVREHSAGYTDRQIGELFWGKDERRHITIDDEYWVTRKERR